MVTIAEIREKLHYYKEDLYSATRGEQREDASYYDDTFKIPWIKAPIIPSRTGGGAELVDEPVEQIAAGKLIAYRNPLKETDKDKTSALKLSSYMNTEFLRRWMRQNPNPKLEFVKNLFIRGEAWMHPIHNMRWLVAPRDKTGLPIILTIPDPMIIYANPAENDEGVPDDVIICYERMPWIIKQLYPHWSNPLKSGDPNQNETVTWVEYWDRDVRYWEADGEPILKGDIQPNPYRFVPFIHKVSGFGKSSNEGKPEELIVSRIRKYRDLLKREASSTSDIDSIIHMFANKDIDVQPNDPQTVIPEDFRERYIRGYGNIHELPFGITVTKSIEDLPAREVLEWNYAIKSELGRKTPQALSGQPVGGSGRLQDMSYSTAMRKFEAQVRSTEDAFATALGMALRECEAMPGLMPDQIDKEDINKNYEVTVELKSQDPIEISRRAADGDFKYKNGIIDLNTNLVQYQGYTQDEADKILAMLLVDDVTRNDPIMRQIMGQDLARELGLEDRYQQLLEMAKQMQSGTNKVPEFESEGGAPRTRNVKTEEGREMSDLGEHRVTRESP